MILSELPDIYCLGLKSLGACNYDLSNPSLSFFSVGQLVSVIALILTFSQIARPIIKLRRSTRSISQWFLLIGVILAIFFVFTAAILRAWPSQIPVFGYPIFWEFLAGSLFVGAGLSMIYQVSTETHLSKYNAEKYLDLSKSIIARGSIDDLRDYGDEIIKSISIAVMACQKHQLRSIQADNHNDSQKMKPTDFERICYTLLDLWSDKEFCNVLVVKCPDTAIEILKAIQNSHLYESGAYALVQELINQAMSDQDSILHREVNFSGLGRFKSFMTTAFSQTDFVCSRLRPLQAWSWHTETSITAPHIRLYGEAIGICLRASIDEQSLNAIYPAFYSALKEVNSIAQQAVWRISQLSENQLSQSEYAKILSECTEIHRKIVITIAALPNNQQPLLNEININPEIYNPINDRSIYCAVAENSYQFIERLAMCKGHDDGIRLYAMEVWDQIFSPSAPISNTLNAVRQRFLYYLRNKIDKNLDINHWYYPMVSRILISIWGIPNCTDEVKALPEGSSRDESSLYVYFYTLLKQNFFAIRSSNIKHANDLLPEGVLYIDEPPSLQQTWFRDKTTLFNLIVPNNT